jgi:hypothetical protein
MTEDDLNFSLITLFLVYIHNLYLYLYVYMLLYTLCIY